MIFGQTEKWELLKEAGLSASITAVGRVLLNRSGITGKSTEPQHRKQEKVPHDVSPSLFSMDVI
ncbi:MAG: hypothetical protein ACT6Q8_19090 [Niveispirillum sp.]|uniref:hypothetical protein n=1 Tax=Niveispirillum sp. TaxID=1917217 RepID=UPI0012E29B71